MGDTGSLSAGAAIGAISVITKNELILLVQGFVCFRNNFSNCSGSFFQINRKRVFRWLPYTIILNKKAGLGQRGD